MEDHDDELDQADDDDQPVDEVPLVAYLRRARRVPANRSTYDPIGNSGP